MKLSSILISTLIVAGIIIGLGNAYVEINNAYTSVQENLTVESESTFSRVNSTFSEVSGYMSDMENRTIGIASKFPNFDIFGGLIDTGLLFLDVIGIILEIPNVLTNIVNIGLETIGIPVPSWVVSVSLGVLVIIVVLKVVGILLKREI